jgi:hypothetical protein
MAFLKETRFFIPSKRFFCHFTVSQYFGKIFMPNNRHHFCHCASEGSPIYNSMCISKDRVFGKVLSRSTVAKINTLFSTVTSESGPPKMFANFLAK